MKFLFTKINSSMKKYAIIVAGGEGKRMGGDVPKQFLILNGKPVLYYALKAFHDSYKDLEIILVLPENHIAAGQEIIDAYFDYNRVKISVGGSSRFQSVKNGLEMIKEESIIFVHDAVRCLVTEHLIQSCYASAEHTGTAIPVVPCTDSVRLMKDDINEFFPRQDVMLVQTPQVFHSKILIPAYNIEYKEKYTDEASVVDAFGMKLSLVDGESDNIKITLPKDLVIAEYIIQQRKEAKA